MALLSVALENILSCQRPAVLIQSLPRSGSSWVGEIMGSAENAIYLREPISQHCMDRKVTAGPLAFVDPVAPRLDYQRVADMAFRGGRGFGPNIARSPQQWSWLSRKRRRVVIKEVNPFATGFFLRRYAPYLVVLLRHPASVASSFKKMGWGRAGVEYQRTRQILRSGLLARWKDQLKLDHPKDDWESLGILQGAALRVLLSQSQSWSSQSIVRYEDLCLNPEMTFRQLFEHSRLRWHDDIAQLIRERSSSHGDLADPYDTRRDSSAMATIWRQQMTEEQIEAVRAGFRLFDLPWYSDDRDW